ncbi:MAG: hypothetical protein JW881_07835 [Spirochaetales bacterium]|nr:hypothetical protein [Spirochaetales bacterium]
MYRCYYCKSIFEEDIEVFRSTTCSGCGRDVKVCMNCRFYSPGAYWDCRETIDEQVIEKDKANFCAYFELKEVEGTGEGKTQQDKAKDQFKKLFGNGE